MHDPMIRPLIQRTANTPVYPRWDGWRRSWDEPLPPRADGAERSTSCAKFRLTGRTVYPLLTILLVAAGCVGTFSSARDVAWRLGAPHNIWEPALWESTSIVVIFALLPLARAGALLLRGADRLLAAGLAVAVLALVFSALHIVGMGFLREWAYRLAGWQYAFPWSNQIVYELRKDLYSFTLFVIAFWSAERPSAQPPAASAQADPTPAPSPASPPQFWLRDGRTSILVDPAEIVSVISAGNYVEYQLTGGRTHLIRATLQSQEAQLAPLGITRVHRGRLVNIKRIVAAQWRASGDFELRLDSGETVAGSRRFKAAVAALAG
jgi:DNA-binding LytR/AlgR family response regulator